MLSLLLLAGCGSAATEPVFTPTPPPVQRTALWLWRELPMSAALEELAAAYNDTQPEHPLELRVFDSEEAMGAAMNEAQPDLLLCTGERALALYGQDKLREAAPTAMLAPAFIALNESVGRSFFPLGAEVPVLAVNAAAYLASPVTNGVGDAALGGTESLCSLAAAHGRSTDQPFFAADSWAGLFALALRQSGEDFDGRWETLRESARAAALYNVLAETAYAHGLYIGAEDAATLVRRGYVVAALLPSRALSQEADGLMCYPAPLTEGGEPLLPAQVWGLAVTVTDESALAGVNDFLSWLLEADRIAALALDEGLLPSAAGAVEPAEEGSLDWALQRALEHSRLALDEDALWRAQAEDFDARLRAALALLD